MIDGALAISNMLRGLISYNQVDVSPVPNKNKMPKIVYQQTYEELLQTSNCEITTTQQRFTLTSGVNSLQENYDLKLDVMQAIKSYNTSNGNPLFLESIQFDTVEVSPDKYDYIMIFEIVITK